MNIFKYGRTACPPWIYNIDAMRMIRPELAKTAAGWHSVVHANSIGEGYTAYTGNLTYLVNRWDRILQAAFRKEFGSGDVGGFGFIPCCRGDGDGDVGGGADGATFSADFMTFSGTWTKNASGQGVGGRSQSCGNGSNSILLHMDGSIPERQTASFALVGARGAAQSPAGRIDVKVGSAPTPGGGTVLSTTQDWSGATSFGYHYAEIGAGILDPTADNYILLTAQAATKGMQPDGIFCMKRGSADAYIHNTSQSGSKPAPAFDTTVTNRKVANYDNWTGAYGPCSQTNLCFMDWTTNSEHGEADPGVSGTAQGTPLATYLTQLEASYDAWGALGVPIIHLAPMPRGGASGANSENNYRTWMPAERALAMSKKHVCYIDTWQMIANSSRAAIPALRGWNASDSLHFTLAMQPVWAEVLNRVTLWFRPDLRTVKIYPGLF